jgi:single-strand DNA-binding protein
MAKSVNKVILIGNLGKDPEVKYTPSGMAVARFTLATNDRFKDKDGNWQDRTEWHNLVAFQRTAEIVGEYLKKGRTCYVEGKLQTSSWDDKESGQKRYRTEIIVNDLVLLGGGREGGGEGGGGGYSGSRSGGAKSGGDFDQRGPDHDNAPASSNTGEITDEDIPF